MVIQRWQSILLFIASIAMAMGCLMPIGIIEETPSYPIEFPVLLVLNILTSLLLFIDIFLYGNLKRQQNIAAISAMLSIASFITSLILIYHSCPGMKIAWNGNAILSLCAAIIALRAKSLMKRDQKKLDGYDRLR